MHVLLGIMETKTVLWIFLTVLYLLLVRLLRYRRVDAIKRKHGMRERSEYATLTADQAQDILQELVEMEFPKFMGFSIVFALFKTYGIPSVSSLLVSTGELASTETASKRTADTGVLILEFCLNKQSSQRSMEAIARMNYLHSPYIKSGKISNEDLLYTLSVFALEPVRWIGNYEWRQMSDLELCATGTFWKAIGDKMKIDFNPLPSCKSGWVDGLQWLQEVQVWSEEYERDNMIPAETNRKLALSHLKVIFINLPRSMSVLGTYLVSFLVGERLRTAMMLPRPPWLLSLSLEKMLLCRKLILRHLMLPRAEYQRKKYISEEPEKNGRYSSREYLSHPWYVKPTFGRRWGPKAWLTRLLGRKVPGDDGDKYNPEGYKILQVGPERLMKAGSKDMEADLKQMRAARTGMCPFGSLKG